MGISDGGYNQLFLVHENQTWYDCNQEKHKKGFLDTILHTQYEFPLHFNVLKPLFDIYHFYLNPIIHIFNPPNTRPQTD